MRFWCSVSDRCSGKIGEGEVPRAQFQLCLLSLFGTKESCHICHDWCGCRKIVRAYLHETPEGEPTPAGPFCIAIICPAHSLAQARTLQQNPNQFTFLRTIHHAIQALWSLLPNVSLPITCLQRAHSLRGKIAPLKTSQQDISPFVFVSTSYHSEMLMTNDVLRRIHFSTFDSEEYLKIKKGNNSTFGWSFRRSYLQLCSILRASEDPSEFGLIWRTMK